MIAFETAIKSAWLTAKKYIGKRKYENGKRRWSNVSLSKKDLL